MGTFLSRAEEILETAVSSTIDGNSDLVILVRHDGGLRIFDGAGWGLAGLLAEYGAREVYKVERRGTIIRVTGQSLSQTCVLERELGPASTIQLSAWRATPLNRTLRPWQ